MATVTKLKAAVNNQNLPILGIDGNLYSYYFGRYINKLSEMNVNPTSEEKVALSTFIESGIENGWIDYVKYFMPFVGNNTNPLSGIVPVIDKLNDYEILPSSIDSTLFDYNINGKIVSWGHPEAPNLEVEIPIRSSDMNNGTSIFINRTYKQAEVGIIPDSDISHVLNSKLSFNNKTRIAYEIFGNLKISNAYRETEEQQNVTHSTIPHTSLNSFSVGDQIGLFHARYLNNENGKVKSYIIKKGATSPLFTSDSDSTAAFYENTPFYLGTADVRSNKFSINCFAVVDVTATESILYEFNQDVFALTTALGR